MAWITAAALRPTLEAARCHHLPVPLTSLSPPRYLIAPTRSVSPSVRSMSSGSHLEESVESTVSANPVVVYSKTWCPYSMEVKLLLKRLGAQLLVVELDQLGMKGPQLQNALAKLTGQTTVPNVFIGGKHIGGCTDTLRLYQTGELTKLLSELNTGNKSVNRP